MKPSKELQAEWAKKLADSGFNDIENASNNLKQFHGSRWFSREVNVPQMMLQQEYFARAGQFLHHYAKFTPFTRQLWELHAEGHSYPSIAKLIKTRKKSSVFSTIKELRKEFFLWYKEEGRNEQE